MARAFWGLHARGLSLWLGGVYSMVKLCSPQPRERDGCIARGSALWKRLVILEQMFAADRPDTELLEFWHGFLWPKGVAYRELLVLLSEGRLEEAIAYSWRIHSSTSGHCCSGRQASCSQMMRPRKKGAENDVVNVQRLHSTAAAAARDAFPGTMQTVITKEETAARFGRGRWDGVRAHVATLGRDKRSLSLAAFRPPSTPPAWLTKPSPVGCGHTWPARS